MGKKVRIQLAPADRDRLEALIANGNTPQKHVRRAGIVLLAGNGVGTDEIQRRLGVSKPTIRRWRCRYIEAGVDGLQWAWTFYDENLTSLGTRDAVSTDYDPRTRRWYRMAI